MGNELPLSSVHDALQAAQIAERDRVAMTHVNFKCLPAPKAIAESICKVHGTTLSAYLRSCIGALVLDFGGPKLSQQLDNCATAED